MAAGKGTRINTGSIIVPKPLYKVGTKALIEHTILNLKEAGIFEFIVVVGFMSEHVRDYLNDGSELGVKIDYIYNPHFHRELGVSAAAVKKVVSNENFILVMADTIIDPKVVEELIKNHGNGQNCVLCIDKKLDRVNDIEEATKVLVKDSKIVDINKKLTDYNGVDCGLFLMTPRIFEGLEKAQSKLQDSLTDGVKEVMKCHDFLVVDIGSSSWMEVDTRSDLLICEELIVKEGWRRINDRI